MAAQVKEGVHVRIADRDATAEDAKSGLFYNHFRGLTGVVQKVYDTQEVAIEVDQSSLAEGITTRHTEIQEQMKAKWLDGLSDEARNRLTEKERIFRLRYTVLVAAKDVSPTA